MDSPKGAADLLAKTLDMDRRALIQKLDEPSTFAWIKRQVSPDEVAKVAALGLNGIGFVKESKRFYPNKDLASHVLGFVGLDSRGLEGIELGYDEYLHGTPTHWRVQRDALGRTYLDRDIDGPDEIKGANITLTLDRRIQYITEKALAQAVEKFNAKGGMALVVQPQSGEILASAIVPDFNPNLYQTYAPAQRRNRVITDTFDPGSTFKVFIVSGALEDALVKPQDNIYCENGAYMIDRHVIHDTHPYGILPVSKIIKFSSNIGALKIGEKLGPARLHQYLNRFSFGQRTGINFPGESVGLLRAAKSWSRLDAANVAFGQGVSVTALQLTMAMAALANDGLLMKPLIVSRITDSSGQTIKSFEPEIARQVVSVQTARAMKEMLRGVVTEGGTGTKAESPGYPAAGKTGTAQKIDRATGTFSDHRYFSSFVGFVPYQSPKLVIFVGLDEPSLSSYGSTVAAPTFREIAQQVLPMLNVPPTLPEPSPGNNSQLKVAATKPGQTKPVGENQPLVVQAAFKNGTTNKNSTNTSKKPNGPATPPNQPVQTADSGPAIAPGTMPDLNGLSMRRVLDKISGLDLKVDFTGSGQAVWQQPQPGASIQSGEVCQVKFEQK
ncbi:MAG: transpeptidase family protein [Deltaproteobacteria bacterium]|nr:transpeptidase family protein [Deltaproteobacteria bacterium]